MQLRNLVPWLAAIVLWPAVTVAGTFRVEQDGKGDFITIQGGLDAASPGDTVLIGPGRYETFTTRTFATGGTVKVVGYIGKPDLTIVGVDSTQVVLGPAAPTTQIEGLSTVGLGIDGGAARARVQGVVIENMQIGGGSSPKTWCGLARSSARWDHEACKSLAPTG